MEINQENVEKVQSFFGPELPESDVLRALRHSGNNPDAAVRFILNNAQPVTVVRTCTATGARISAHIQQEAQEEQCKEGVGNKVDGKPRMSFEEFLKATDTKVMTTEEYLRTQKKEEALEEKPKCQVKEEQCDVGMEDKVSVKPRMSFDEFLKATGTKVMSTEEYLRTQMKEEPVKESKGAESLCGLDVKIRVKEEQVVDVENKVAQTGAAVSKRQVAPGDEWVNAQVKQEASTAMVKVEPTSELKATVKVKEEPDSGIEQKVSANEDKAGSRSNVPSLYKEFEERIKSEALQKPCAAKKVKTEDRIISYTPAEDGDFPEEPGWFLVGRTIVSALSTSKGRKLVDNEIVYFSFPSSIGKFNSIVRFSTKRFGEVITCCDYIFNFT